MNNENHNYRPQPVDTADIVLPDRLNGLIEQLARNVHETWAQGRMEQGWVYGPERSDAAKTHPCLVPYDQLTEEEKQYDRNTCTATLKFILKVGYRIT